MSADESGDQQTVEQQIAAAQAEVEAAERRLDDLLRLRDGGAGRSASAASGTGESEAAAQETQPPVFSTDAVSAAAPYSSAQSGANPAAQPASSSSTIGGDIPYYTAPAYVPAKDHVAAGLLGIVLGCFGIHKFYLGYTTPGFIMLAITVIGGVLTFGIAAVLMIIIGIVEGVIYLTMSQSEFEETHVNRIREWF